MKPLVLLLLKPVKAGEEEEESREEIHLGALLLANSVVTE